LGYEVSVGKAPVKALVYQRPSHRGRLEEIGLGHQPQKVLNEKQSNGKVVSLLKVRLKIQKDLEWAFHRLEPWGGNRSMERIGQGEIIERAGRSLKQNVS